MVVRWGGEKEVSPFVCWIGGNLEFNRESGDGEKVSNDKTHKNRTNRGMEFEQRKGSRNKCLFNE